MKIFQLNDVEWWFAESLDEAYAACLEETGVTRAEQEEDFKAVELTDEQMDVPNQVNTAEDGETPNLVSFREAMELEMATGRKAGLLCASEF